MIIILKKNNYDIEALVNFIDDECNEYKYIKAKDTPYLFEYMVKENFDFLTFGYEIELIKFLMKLAKEHKDYKQYLKYILGFYNIKYLGEGDE